METCFCNVNIGIIELCSGPLDCLKREVLFIEVENIFKVLFAIFQKELIYI